MPSSRRWRPRASGARIVAARTKGSSRSRARYGSNASAVRAFMSRKLYCPLEKDKLLKRTTSSVEPGRGSAGVESMCLFFRRLKAEPGRRALKCPHLDSNQGPADYEANFLGRRFEVFRKRRPLFCPPLPPVSMASMLVRRVCVEFGRSDSSHLREPPSAGYARRDEAAALQRLSSLAEDRKVAIVGEDAIALLPGQLAGDSESHEALHPGGGGRKRQAGLFPDLLQRGHGPLS